MNIFAPITENVRRQLETGVVPWHQSWANGLPAGKPRARRSTDALPQQSSVQRVRPGPDNMSAASVQEVAGESRNGSGFPL